VSSTDPAAAPVVELSDRFWEELLALNPSTATVYGDERYADRLEDPSPAGRAKTRALVENTKREAEAIPVDGLSIEDRITRDMLIVIADLGVEEDDQGTHRLAVVDQIGGPQTLLPQLCQFQKADTPERFDKFLARLHAYPAFMDANIGVLREGIESGLTAPRIVAERTVQQLERLLAIPIEEAIVPSMAQVASDADRERVATSSATWSAQTDAAFLARSAATTAAFGRARTLVGPGGGTVPNKARADDARSPGADVRHRAGNRRGRDEAPEIARTRASATTRGPPRRAWRGPANTRARDELSPERAKTSSGRWPSRRASSGSCRRPAAT
jgi:uncharacterized protein (DUF885 family)